MPRIDRTLERDVPGGIESRKTKLSIESKSRTTRRAGAEDLVAFVRCSELAER